MSIMAACTEPLLADMKTEKIDLPSKIDDWTLSGPVRLINAETIFEYMNGAGELYLGYGFNRLEVREYSDEPENTILVELYFMNTPADAFGLLSLDWSGEPVLVDNAQTSTSPPRALYGGGLLRIWADTVYARVMTFPETDSAKAAILSIGHHIVKDCGPTPVPVLMRCFPEAVSQVWKLRRDRMGYFRSHLVLNSLYYLSHQNIFNLDHSVEAVTAPFERQSDQGNKERIQALMIHYATQQKALKGVEHFHAAYLDDFHKENPANAHHGQAHYFQIEDGWLAYVRNGKRLTVVFECPNRDTAMQFISEINKNAK